MTEQPDPERRMTADLNAVIDSVMDRIPDASVEEALGPACERVNSAFFEDREFRYEPELAVKAVEELTAWLDTELTALTALRKDTARIKEEYFGVTDV